MKLIVIPTFIFLERSGGLLRDQEEIKQLQSVLINLKELVVSDNSYLSDALLNRLVAIAPNLQSLSLEGCQVRQCSFFFSFFSLSPSLSLFSWTLNIYLFDKCSKWICVSWLFCFRFHFIWDYTKSFIQNILQSPKKDQKILMR